MLTLRESIGIRVASLVGVLGFVFFAPPTLLPLVVTTVGFGHFGLAFRYQAEGKHLTHTKLLILAVSFVLIMVIAFTEPFTILIFINGIGFITHFCLDEARLLNGKHSLYTTLEALPFLVFVTGIFAEAYLIEDWYTPAMLIAGITVLIYVALMIRSGRIPNATSYSFYAWGLITFVAYNYVRFMPEKAGSVFWAVALLHFAIWYGFYWYKLQNAPEAKEKFVIRTLVINAVVVVLAALYYFQYPIPYLALFLGAGFYITSLLHGISSIRPQELTASLR